MVVSSALSEDGGICDGGLQFCYTVAGSANVSEVHMQQMVTYEYSSSVKDRVGDLVVWVRSLQRPWYSISQDTHVGHVRAMSSSLFTTTSTPLSIE